MESSGQVTYQDPEREDLWCGVNDCGRRAHARGLCRTHYERLRIHGDVDAARPIGLHELHGLRSAPEYAIWDAIVQRCENPKHKNFFRYGGRGIKICRRWRGSFSAFLADMGSRPSPAHEIERINNDLGYEPSNCKWATRKEQMLNARSNVWLEFNGRRMRLTEWAAELGVRPGKLYGRRHLGWPVERILTQGISNGIQRVRRKA